MNTHMSLGSVFFSLSVCLPACLSVCLSVCLSICMYVRLYVCFFLSLILLCEFIPLGVSLSVTVHFSMADTKSKNETWHIQ